MNDSKEDIENKMLKELTEIMSFSKNSLLILRKEVELIGYSCLIFVLKKQILNSDVNQ